MSVCIVGWAHTPFGRLEDDLESLITRAAGQAMQHAQVSGSNVDGLWLGNLNGGFVPETFCSSLMLQADEGLRFSAATRVENACASGSAAVYAAIDAISAGRCKVAVVVGAEKMTAVSGTETTRILGNCSYVPEEAALGLTFPGIFAQVAEQYFTRYGDHSATLAHIAAKGHANGMRNPWAHLRKDLGFEFCNTVSQSNPLISGPLRKTDCSLVSDGAAALVLVHESMARDFPRAVKFRAGVQVNDFLAMSRRDLVAFEGPREAWNRAYQQAGISVNDLSFAEVHDCFTIAELLAYEAMGLRPTGQGAQAILDGTVQMDGKLPVNPSGGLKAKGHPIGATGVSQHVLAAMQLCNEAGDMQVANAQLAGVFNMGGAAVASYVSVLERLQ